MGVRNVNQPIDIPKFDKQPPFYLYHYVVRNYNLQGWEHLYIVVESIVPLLCGIVIGYLIKH